MLPAPLAVTTCSQESVVEAVQSDIAGLTTIATLSVPAAGPSTQLVNPKTQLPAMAVTLDSRVRQNVASNGVIVKKCFLFINPL